MAGRPKRETEVEVVFLRLPKDLIGRITRCTGILQAREGVKRNTTQAYTRLLEIACDAVGHQQTPPSPVIAEIASIANGTPMVYDDMLGFLGDEDEEETLAQPVDVPQAAETPSSAVEPVPEQTPSSKARGGFGLSREKLGEIANDRTLCEGLSLRAFAKRLHDKGIYSARDRRTGEEKPVESSRLGRWLEQAREEGLL